jgi:release factor glutamine methyltransferase
MSNITEFLQKATEILSRSGIAEPRREAHSLLAFALKKDKTFLIGHPEYELSEAEEKFINKIIARRANREPFQYITGVQEFYGLDFEVNETVLIPRPETEMLVKNAIEILQNLEKPHFCEVGTGSGCISVSILHNLSKAVAVGLDISAEALRMTRQNAEKHGVAERLQLRNSDVFSALPETKFDLIVSNPPYIPKKDFSVLQPEVKNFEPEIALSDGKDGLSIIEQIISDAPKFLRSNGFLLLEIGFGQAEKVEIMFSETIWQSVEILPDLQGIPRMVRAKIK